MTWELTLARVFLLLHAFAGFGALAVSVHLLQAALRGRSSHRQTARYGLLVAALFSAALLSGALVYPAFRVTVRGAYLDQVRPALTGLFEIKEHAGAIGLALALGLWLHFRRRPEAKVSGHWTLAALLAFVAVFDVIVGLILVMERSV